MSKYSRKIVSWVLAMAMFMSMLTEFCSSVVVRAAENPTLKVVLVGNLQKVLGHDKDWDPEAETTRMKDVGNGFFEFTGTLPAGTYEYKVAMGSWTESYGIGNYANSNGKGNNDGNINITLDKEQTVTFYYNHNTHKIADSTFYQSIPTEKLPRLVGDIQTAIGDEVNWDPNKAKAVMMDSDYDNMYSITKTVPKGSYQFKVVLGVSWDENYGLDGVKDGKNIPLNVLSSTQITFCYDKNTHKISHNYKGDGTDGMIDADKLYHDSFSTAFRHPFGAVKEETPVTVRLASKKNDLTRARLFVKNNVNGSTKIYNMELVANTDLDVKKGNENLKYKADIWEVTFTPPVEGVYGYKFIVGDLETQMEYGDDGDQGGIGSTVEKNSPLFQLTVYDKNYKTPDWMKESVVVQIFPDRFFNGNSKNDTAKQYARGFEPIEHRKWDQLPDNPRIYEKGLDQYDGDAVYCNDFFGGDIEGVTKKLDYLKSLGVNTVYLNPIASAASNHKYDATDYMTIDPMFGTEKEFLNFTKELKKRKMHLIVDGVFNHVGDDSIYFDRYGKYKMVGAYEYWSSVYDLMNTKNMEQDDAEKQTREQFIKQGQIFSPYKFEYWFNIENEKVKGNVYDSKTGKQKEVEYYKYQGWWGFDSLPEFKSMTSDEAIKLGLAKKENVNRASEYNNQMLTNYIYKDENSVAKTWLKRGATGWRLDVANEVDNEFWRDFRKELKNPKLIKKLGYEPLILGEIWDDASKYFLGDQYDSVMNYRFKFSLLDFLKGGNAELFDSKMKAVLEDYPSDTLKSLMNLIDSHDTARAVYFLGHGSESFERAEMDKKYNYILGKNRLKLAAIFQLGYLGAPTIYYGDEAGVTGSKDPDCRRVYPWSKEDEDLITLYQKAGKVRTEHTKLFAHGSLFTLYNQGDVYVYGRKLENEYAIIAINRGNEDQTITLDVVENLPNGIKLTDGLDAKYKAVSNTGKVQLNVKAMTGRILLADKGQKLDKNPGVTDLQVKEASHKVILTWKASKRAKAYKVFISDIKGSLYRLETTVNTTTATIDNLQNGKSYYFAVTALDENQNHSYMTSTQKAVIPHDVIGKSGELNIETELNNIIDITKAVNVSALAYIKGATDTGKQAEGLTARLLIKHASDTEWTTIPAQYVGQGGEGAASNKFSAQFTPIIPGIYSYKMQFSTTGGREWIPIIDQNGKEVVGVTKEFIIDPNDNIKPADSIHLKHPMVESGQVNLKWSAVNLQDDFVQFDIIRDGIVIGTVKDKSTLSYKDLDVENGRTYKYVVTAYDKSGNQTISNSISVKPDLVIVKVIFKLHAPAYTSLDSTITIPGTLNSWNTGAFEMSRNGAVTPDWTFETEVPDGQEITYKYVKGSTWEQEGLPDHTPLNINDDDVSYYGYGASGTDLKVTVQNQGDNTMVIEDTILRWIDMPLVVSSPANESTVSTQNITITGSAIKEGVLTINGQTVQVNEDMNFSYNVPLSIGKNVIKLHIEPSEENKKDIFNNDAGKIQQVTKDIELIVNRK